MVNVFEMGKYKKYIDELTAILDASSEIIFLCNNFDITRIHDLFINIIENYNYYEEGKIETSNTEPLGDEISKSAEYIKMKEYIDKNFENIKDKCDCFTIKLDGFRIQYLPDNAETEDSDDTLIRDNFKSQYKTIRINLEDIQRELSKIKKITEFEIKAIKDDDIQFNIFPITKSNMMYSPSLYSSFKMIFKNLQIIDSNENEITEQELDEINKDLKKLYINLIKNFNVNTINAQELVLKDIIDGLNKEGLSLKEKYNSYIKKGGDVKGEVDEGEEGKGKGEEGEGEGENVKNLEEEAERKEKEAEEAKKKTEDEAAAAKKKAEEEAAAAKKKAEEEAAATKKKAEEEAKKKEAEEAKRKDKEAEDAKKKNEEDPFVFNFEYNHSSCYVNSALQMLIDNEELCDKIINAANTQTFGDTFNGDKTSDSYLLYLLNKIIVYYRKNKDSIGKPKKPSYNEYILPLREYLDVVNQAQFKLLNDADPSDLFEFILNKLENLEINKEYDETKLLILNGDEEESFDKIIKYQIPPITSNKENLIFKIGRSRSKRIPNTDAYLRDENNKTITEEVTKSITLSPKLILGEDNKNSTYILKGFIHFVPPGHYIYYKSLNNSKNEWVILDDLDTNKFPVNDTEHKVDGHPLGKNGDKILQKGVKTTGSTLFYYKKEKDDTALNASPIGVEKRANAEEDDSYLQAALAASLADNESVKNIVGNYTFETKPSKDNDNGGFTHIYEDENFKYNEENNEDTVKLMASLNAGHENLRIGGGTINKRFNEIIRENNPLQITEKDLQNLSVKMHISCYMNCYKIPGFNSVPNVDDNNSTEIKRILALVNAKVAENKEGQLYPFDNLEELFPNTIIEKMFLYIPPLKNRIDNKFKFNDTNLIPGDIFIDILRYKANKNDANKAMIYCVGPHPNTNTTDNLFITAINNIGKNIANAIKLYNEDYKNQKIDYVRICLISGDAYKPKNVATREIAKALMQGIFEINKDSKIIYNFAYVNEEGNSDGSFKLAFDELNKKAPPP